MEASLRPTTGTYFNKFLEDRCELVERVELEQLLAFGRGRQVSVLQHPGIRMEEEDCMQPCGERWIDVAFDAVADHPTGVRRELVALHYSAICGRIFFGDDLDSSKVFGEPTACELVGLLGLVALGHEDEAMPRGEFVEGLGHTRKQLDLLLCNRARKAANALGCCFGHRLRAEAMKAGDEGAGEAGEPVSVGEDGFALDGVQRLPDVGRRVFAMI